MLQTSSLNQTHVLHNVVASNSIYLLCLEERTYIITLFKNPLLGLIILLNPLPVLVALKILSFTSCKNHTNHNDVANIISVEIFAPFQFVPVHVKT